MLFKLNRNRPTTNTHAELAVEPRTAVKDILTTPPLPHSQRSCAHPILRHHHRLPPATSHSNQLPFIYRVNYGRSLATATRCVVSTPRRALHSTSGTQQQHQPTRTHKIPTRGFIFLLAHACIIHKSHCPLARCAVRAAF